MLSVQQALAHNTSSDGLRNLPGLSSHAHHVQALGLVEEMGQVVQEHGFLARSCSHGNGNTNAIDSTVQLKPRLSKSEVELLETEFCRNPKPSSVWKREIAESLQVDPTRINNWFQNRRAREKKMRNLKEYEQRRKGEIGDLNSPGLEASPTPELRALSPERQRRSYAAAAFPPTSELNGPSGVGPAVSESTATGQLYDSNKGPSPHAPNPWVDIEAAPRFRQESDDHKFLADYSTLPRLKRDEQGKAILARLMGYLYFLIGCWYFKKRTSAINGFRTVPQYGSSGNYSNGTTESSAPTMSNGHQPGKRSTRPSMKRRLQRQEDDDSQEENDPKQQKLVGRDVASQRRFACPFFKKNPLHFWEWRSCPGPGWGTTHRVKEHLYRSHLLPITCPRCHEAFESEKTQLEHLTAEKPCQKREKPKLEGVDSSTEKILRSRKHMQKHNNEEDRWREIYVILFPGTNAESIPNPYYEYHKSAQIQQPDAVESEFAKYEQFLGAELPSRVRQQLEIRIEAALNPLDEFKTLKGKIIDIVRDTQLQLFKLYKTGSSNLPTETDSTPVGQGGISDVPNLRSSNPSTPSDNYLEIMDPELHGTSGKQDLGMDFDFGLFDGVIFDLAGITGSDQVSATGLYDWNDPVFT
ncbi:hypothetical protein BKA56DRAFT_593014 [Ilyonectria sp. MPI-CAGE-AT-0026]|nr:hypothetical protein BKA56DRAFT_593014 [Ilyonectria sp. MPI-CAGE-AT-0026]